jgi:hypothetical protein
MAFIVFIYFIHNTNYPEKKNSIFQIDKLKKRSRNFFFKLFFQQILLKLFTLIIIIIIFLVFVEYGSHAFNEGFPKDFLSKCIFAALLAAARRA